MTIQNIRFRSYIILYCNFAYLKKNLASTVQAAVRILELYYAPAITFSTTLNLRKVQNLRHENYSIECDFAPKHQTFLTTLDNQLPSLSRVHGFKDFLCSVHLLGSFDGQIYSLKHFHNCKFVHQRIQEDEHYRETMNSWEWGSWLPLVLKNVWGPCHSFNVQYCLLVCFLLHTKT